MSSLSELPTSVAITAAGLVLSAVALVTSLMVVGVYLLLTRKLKPIHQRLHQLEFTNVQLERQLGTLSRAASTVMALQGGSESLPRCHAQHGEELYLWQMCGWKRDGVFVEIGAYDGVSLSNSLFFEELGWKGLLVEAHPDLVEKCRQSRLKAKVVHAALGPTDSGTVTFSMVEGASGMDTLSFASTTPEHLNRIVSRGGTVKTVNVPARTLSSVLQEQGITHIDWMSIDVEGSELDVLQAADLKTVRPALLMVEDNLAGRENSVRDLLASQGYRSEMRIGCNDIYRST